MPHPLVNGIDWTHGLERGTFPVFMRGISPENQCFTGFPPDGKPKNRLMQNDQKYE
jgi:hypothetical protein